MEHKVTPETLRKSVVMWAEDIIVNHKQELVACVFATDGIDVMVLQVDPVLLSSEDRKDQFVQSVRRFARERNITATCFATEGWAVSSEDPFTDMRPSEHPDRKEILAITTETKDGLTAESWLIEPGRTGLTPMPASIGVQTRFRFLTRQEKGMQA